MKSAFVVKYKTFLLVSKVFSFRHTKQTSKKVVETTFKAAASGMRYFLKHKVLEGFILHEKVVFTHCVKGGRIPLMSLNKFSQKLCE